MMMSSQKTVRIRRAARQIADIIEAALARLSPAEREARWRTFEKVTAEARIRRATRGARCVQKTRKPLPRPAPLR